MSDEFGPASLNAVTTRPVLTPLTSRTGAAPRTFAKPCTSAEARDGTVMTAEWMNLIAGNMNDVLADAQALGLTPGADYTPGADHVLTRAIARLIAGSDVFVRRISTNTTITVNAAGGAQFTTIQGALDSLKFHWIEYGVRVTINVAAGVYAPVVVDHPCGERIQIIGVAPVGWPAYANLTADRTASLVAVRAFFPTRIVASTAVSTVTVRGSGLGLLRNMMLEGPGTAGAIGGIAGFCETVQLEQVAIGGYSGTTNGGIAMEKGYCRASRVFLFHCFEPVRALNTGATIDIDTALGGSEIAYCTTGLRAQFGFLTMSGGGIRNAASAATWATQNGNIQLTSVTMAANAVNHYAQTGGVIVHNLGALGTVSGTASHVATDGGYILDNQCTGSRTASPAAGTAGNNHGYVRVI